MLSLLIGLARFWLAIRTAWRDLLFRLLAALTASLLLVGTWVFHKVEGWAYLDCFYFSAISLATNYWISAWAKSVSNATSRPKPAKT